MALGMPQESTRSAWRRFAGARPPIRKAEGSKVPIHAVLINNGMQSMSKPISSAGRTYVTENPVLIEAEPNRVMRHAGATFTPVAVDLNEIGCVDQRPSHSRKYESLEEPIVGRVLANVAPPRD
ncbi:hypothetical protein KM043_007327 [Ampulex compressa]|nr:hypothetical protein KM043_007327 [Ampulex compressa]